MYLRKIQIKIRVIVSKIFIQLNILFKLKGPKVTGETEESFLNLRN